MDEDENPYLSAYEERLLDRLDNTQDDEERKSLLHALAEAEGEALAGDGQMRP